MALQGIVEAPLVSYCSSFPSNQDHRPENSKRLVALSLRPIWILLLHICLWPCAESFFDMLEHSSGQVDSGLAVTVFFVTVCLSPRKCPSGGCFVGQFDSCHTDPSFRQSASIGTMIIDGCLMKYNNARFRLSLHINVTHRCRNIVLWNTEVRSRSNMITLCNFQESSRNVVELRHLDRDPGLLLYLLENFVFHISEIVMELHCCCPTSFLEVQTERTSDEVPSFTRRTFRYGIL